MKNNRLQFLLKLLVDNDINEQELKELANLLSQPDDEYAIDAELKETWDKSANQIELSDTVYQQIISHPRFSSAAPKEKSALLPLIQVTKRWYFAAAILLALCSMGVVFYWLKSQSQFQNGINPGYTKINKHTNKDQTHVTLTLSNGKKLVLDDTATGKIITEDNVSITKNKDGQLVYDLSSAAAQDELAYNTITTPIGSNHQVILSDGTKVWLNAKSSLRFPVVFNRSERRVELSGEAYFEVANQKNKPFLLTAKAMTVQVLGTHFNVAAYDDDQTVKASLLEGAIKASYQSSSLLLKPGQQALLKNASSNLVQRSFNVDEVMDWKNGYFIFRNEPIDEIMKKISRWYHIEVKYQGKLSNEAFGGKYLKSNSLGELLSSLELTGTVKFKIEGRRVTVMQ